MNKKQAGKVGLALALSAGASLKAGEQIMVEVDFQISPGAPLERSAVSFSDQPIPREVASVVTETLKASYVDGTVLEGGIQNSEFRGRRDARERSNAQHRTSNAELPWALRIGCSLLCVLLLFHRARVCWQTPSS